MTDLPPGVCRNDKNPNRPFYIYREHPQTGRRTQQSFATVEEAEAARKQEDEAVLRRQEERNEERRRASKRNRDERNEALASKRAADLARNGNNCAIEREYTERLVEEASGRSVVLNDFTLADWLLDVRDGDERFGNVQVKVTQKAFVYTDKKGNASKKWQFAIDSEEGAKYANMLVVCYAMDVGIAWIFHGNDLANKTHITITEGNTWERKALAKVDGGPRSVVAFLREQFGKHAEGLVRTTEEEARNAFASEEHRKEKEAIDLYEAFFPYEYEWPREQGSHVDRIERGPTVGCVGPVDARLQHKSAKPHGVGFQCTLRVGGGRQNGKQLTGPYPVDAFDFLVVTAAHEGNAHFWRIPMAALEANRCLEAMSITVHLPEGVGRKAYANNTSLWTREYYLL